MADDAAMLSSVQTALVYLQNAQEELSAARSDLLHHNADPEAHPDILELIARIKGSDNVYSNEQIHAIFNELIAEAVNNVKNQYEGIENLKNQTELVIDELTNRVLALEEKINNPDTVDTRTDLERSLQAVEDRYAPILASLQSAFKEASDLGNQDTAARIRQNINDTLDEKQAAIIAVIDAYQSANG